MAESLRSTLYLLGLAPSLLFGLRFIIQWLQSEKVGRSTVTPLFWNLSLIANSLMCLHGVLQLQYPVAAIQALNGVIAWRNLNLMRPNPTTRGRTLTLMVLALSTVSLLFILQGGSWMRAPTLPWEETSRAHLTPFWHLLGFAGMVLFASRFWVQWWLAERHHKSYFSRAFWWMSLFGALLSLAYFIRLHDIVNILGYSLGILPYVRNLMLMRKAPQKPRGGLFLFAGEPSGDVLGGKLVEALRGASSERRIAGVGGPLMRSSGMEITHPMERFQVMGFSAVIKALPRLICDFRKIKNQILSEQPAAVVLIDYPEFNMFLARALRKKRYQGKIIHYVCPSVWAWRRKRVYALAKTLDCLLTILPFEERCFSDTRLPITYVGHPLVATVDTYAYDKTYSLPTEKPILALFPGSRRHEIALNLPIQWAVAKQFPGHTPVISVARPELMDEIERHIDGPAHFVPQDKRYELMQKADLALATSGTIVLEIGLHAVPTVVTYQLGRFNYLLGRYLFRIHLPFYTLVNIICEREVYPEFIHLHLDVDEIAERLRTLDREACRVACLELRERLQRKDASAEAARTIESYIGLNA